MSIKNKVTQKIKDAFIEELKKTRETGKESGFLLCLEKGRLKIPEKRCKGTECSFTVKDIKKYCPDKTQGAFHTHPYFHLIKEFYKHDPSKKELEFTKSIYERSFARSGLSLETPSHHDVVDTLKSYCTEDTNGTVCVGNDLDMDKVECWTAIGDRIKFKDCSQATIEARERINKAPRKWVEKLFDREIIKLKE